MDYLFVTNFLQIRNQASNLCLDTRFRGPNERFQLEACIKDGQGQGEQVGYLDNIIGFQGKIFVFLILKQETM